MTRSFLTGWLESMNTQTAIDAISESLDITPKEAELIIEKAATGGEITEPGKLNEWLNTRFLPNCISIDGEGYAQMCIDALKILSRTAATDFGSSRQRDLGQLWADMTRGYLGEYAFKRFLRDRWKVDAELGHEEGKLEDYLPVDIHKIKKEADTQYRAPRLKIGVKTVKWNGIWLDIPGNQFNHSDVHVLVKVGTARDHLFAFFKEISVFKDKVLKHGENLGCLSKQESENLFQRLPSFRPIPAYVCGFVKRSSTYKSLSYKGKKGRLNYKITAWSGPVMPGDLDLIKEHEKASGDVTFEGIGEFSHDSGYLFNTGSLLWRDEHWHEVLDSL